MGCDVKPDTCRDQESRTLKMGFYSVAVTGSKRTVTEVALGKVVINTYTLRKVSKLAMSMFQEKDSIAFLCAIGKTDTVNLSQTPVYITYIPDRVFENYKCGFRTNFILKSVKADTAVFDSIKIAQPYITDVYQENFKFYLNPSVK
jgi:hypothetical protein